MSIEKYSLNNNLDIYIKKDIRAPVVLAQIWYKVGSTYEPEKLTGISHMLEHMMFKGTDKYSKDDLNSIVENNGGIQNAFTSFDYTVYYQFWYKKNLELSLSIESSRMTNLLFDENEFIPERKVVLEERNLRVQDKALNYAFEQFMQLAYQKNSRHAPVIGWREDIENYTLDNLKKWYQQNYAPNNSSIVLIGDIDTASALSMAKDYFASIPKSQLIATKKESSLVNIGYRHLKVKKSPNDTAAIILGYITPSLTTDYQDNDPFALLVLNNILGNADASILQQQLVREENLCCYIDSEYSPFIKDEEIFTIPSFDSNILERERIQTLTHIDYLNQQPNYLASLEFSKNLFSNNPYSYPTIGYKETISNIHTKNIEEVFNRYICANNANICLVGAINQNQAQSTSKQLVNFLVKGQQNTQKFSQQTNESLTIKKSFSSKQTAILVGHQLLIDIENPLYFPLKLGNEILGGGLNSLLFNKVREELGLVYNISSMANINPDYGSFVISAQTSNPSLALTTISDVYNDFISTTIDKQTLVNSKKHIEGAHLLSCVKNSSKLNMLSSIANKNLPLDFFDSYVDNISNVTVEEIHQAFLAIQTNKVITVMVGDVE